MWLLAAMIPQAWGVFYWFSVRGKGYVDFFFLQLTYKQFCLIQVLLLLLLTTYCYRKEKVINVHWLLPVLILGSSASVALAFFLSFRELGRFSEIIGLDSSDLISIFIIILLASEALLALKLMRTR